MNPERLQQVGKLFEEALARPRREWAGFLTEVCGDDAELRAEIESLLEHDEQADADFMRVREPRRKTEWSAALDATVALEQTDRDAQSDDDLSIEGYEITRELNRGGQGVVYQAIQQSTKRKVAIKVLLAGPHASTSARRRFKREVELVARLRHPNIISIFDSGAMPNGSRFYVMDYVHGKPLDLHVREKRLPLEETLTLFATVCDAVQYAHQKGVIHRDLKPTNIVVDGQGEPRVLDFGLAKPLATAMESVVSISQEIVGTLPYMSPEQAAGNSDDIDIRTDVYSLGVVLYQVLTGQYPYPVEGSIPDVLRHISETPPTLPSRSWQRDTGVPRRASRRLRVGECPIDGEVETIVLKALAKERERRYQSAGEMARDVRHYLAGEPIEAKCDSLVYVLWKQSRRFFRTAPAAALALLCAILAPGLILSLGFWRQAVRERDVAETVISFLNNDVFQSLDPERVGRDVDLTELLDAASRRIEERFARAPLAEASIRHTLGNFYCSLGVNEKALAHLERALQLRRAELGEQDLAVAESLVSLARVLESMGRSVEAEQHLRDALATHVDQLGERHPDSVATLLKLAEFARRQGNLELDVQLAARARALNPEHFSKVRGQQPAVPSGMGSGVTTETARAELEQARLERGSAHPEVASKMGRLADLLVSAGQYDEAEQLYAEALDVWSREVDAEHPNAREIFVKLEQLCERLGRPERLIPIVRGRLERALANGDSPRLLSSAAWDVVKHADAGPDLLRSALQAARRSCELQPENGAFLNTLGVALYRAGLYEEARSTLVHSDKANDGHPADIAFLAMALTRLGRMDEARRELDRLNRLMQQDPWATDPQSLRFLGEVRTLAEGDEDD